MNDSSVVAHLKMQFDDMEQQQEAASLGMWLFLATEVLFFGGLFLAYIVYRVSYPQVFSAAAKELNITVGTINTAVLLSSSYFMALAVRAVKLNDQTKLPWFLACTWTLGFIFLLLKAYEYYDDFQKHLVPGPDFHYVGPHPSVAPLFYFIYFAMTGLHALHLIIALSVIAAIFFRARKGEFSAGYSNPVEISGLYWHFVDVVWIFLYPLLYLVGRQ